MSDQDTTKERPVGGTDAAILDRQALLAVVESAVEGMALVDTESRLVYANRAFAEMHGCSEETLAGQDASTFYAEGLRPDFAAICAATGNCTRFTGETMHHSRDGRTFPCSERRSVFYDDSGRPVGLILAALDITAQKRLENEFWESEFKYREIVQNANSIIMRWDPDGRITFFNQYARQFFGYAEDEIVGKNLVGTIVPETNSAGHAVTKMIEGIQQRPEHYETNENENVKKNGERVWVSWTNKAILDAHGNMVGILSIGNDITERKRMEQELLQAQKLESLGVLVAGISHDFNNILTEVFGNIGAAKLYLDLAQKVFERLSEAEKASLRAKKLTAELHAFTKSRMPIKKTSSIAALIEDSASFVLRGSNVVCDFAFPDDLWPVSFDEEMLLHVFSTLMINAQQAMPEGGLINIGAENVEVTSEDPIPVRSGRYVKITIEDHGVGISEQVLPRVFDPYFTTKQEHTGLGLATAYSTVRRHRGHISVESTLGSGTTFNVFLPVAREAQGEEAPEEAVPVEKTRVLVMDDDELSRIAVREILTVLNCEAAFAHTVGEALEIFQKSLDLGQPFDLVLGDAGLIEGTKGADVIRTMFQLHTGLKALLCTEPGEVLTEAHRALGFADIVEKPYNIQELSVTINRVVGR